jgi:hypothetical protein
MKRPALFIPFFLLLPSGPLAAQQEGQPLARSGADYIAYAERLIERTRQERPEIASRADELYKRLPAIVDQLEREAKASGQGAKFGMEAGSPQLEAGMERWIGEKGANIDTEIRFTAGRLKTVQRAMQPVKALIEERQRKQQIIASVIMLIWNLLSGEGGAGDEPEAEKNKSDRVGPSASHEPRGDLLSTPSGAAALSVD